MKFSGVFQVNCVISYGSLSEVYIPQLFPYKGGGNKTGAFGQKWGKKTGTLVSYRGKKPVPFEEYVCLCSLDRFER